MSTICAIESKLIVVMSLGKTTWLWSNDRALLSPRSIRYITMTTVIDGQSLIEDS